jgi:hypothetical protein
MPASRLMDRDRACVGVLVLVCLNLAFTPVAVPVAPDWRAAMAAAPYEGVPAPFDIAANGTVPVQQACNQRQDRHQRNLR